jgi:phycocyanobilin:ferredoxin oxidoreductase
LWPELIKFQEYIISELDQHLVRYNEPQHSRFNQNGWTNITWKSERFRRVHLDVVDARETKKLWMMHLCMFPHLDSGAPIYGFDVISGERKVTGAFHDFSVVDPTHEAVRFFSDIVSKESWKKERELPDWARAIFSDSMVAVGNIQTLDELTRLLRLVTTTTDWYLNQMQVDVTFSARDIQNRYAYYQKQNPHTPRTMKALGLDDSDVDVFVRECLFPEV